MSKYYKLLIPLLVGFCLALALGSAEEPSDLCQLCQNKALVKEAILAFDDDPDAPNLFDPNYVQQGPGYSSPFGDEGYKHLRHDSGGLVGDDGTGRGVTWVRAPVTFKFIIAEGDMVATLILYSENWFDMFAFQTFELAIYEISDGKVIKGWVANKPWYPYHEPLLD